MKRLDVPVLLWPAFLDWAGIDALGGEPCSQRSGDKLAAVVGANHARPSVAAKRPLERFLHAAGGDVALDQAGDRAARVLVKHIQDPIRPPVRGAIVLEIKRPHVVWPLARQIPDRAFRTAKRPGLHPPPHRSGPKLTLTPHPMHPLAIHHPPLSPQMLVGHLVTPRTMIPRQATKLRRQRRVQIRAFRLITLGRAVLTKDPTRPPLRQLVATLHMRHRRSPARRAQKFPQPHPS